MWKIIWITSKVKTDLQDYTNVSKILQKRNTLRIHSVFPKMPKFDVLFSFYSIGKGARRCSGTRRSPVFWGFFDGGSDET
jgi:hypothetical protein